MLIDLRSKVTLIQLVWILTHGLIAAIQGTYFFCVMYFIYCTGICKCCIVVLKLDLRDFIGRS